MEEEKVSHAEQNARGWVSSISDMVAALELDHDELERLRDDRRALDDAIAQAQEDYDVAVQGHDEAGTDFVEAQELAQEIDDATAALAQWDKDNGEELAELVRLAEEFPDEDAARERIQEAPLSVQVRSDWTDPGQPMEAAEFEILLSTGGPALRIVGELDEHREPCRAWMEHQDWGTPWTRFFDVERETLLTFCRQFHFGE